MKRDFRIPAGDAGGQNRLFHGRKAEIFRRRGLLWMIKGKVLFVVSGGALHGCICLIGRTFDFHGIGTGHPDADSECSQSPAAYKTAELFRDTGTEFLYITVTVKVEEITDAGMLKVFGEQADCPRCLKALTLFQKPVDHLPGGGKGGCDQLHDDPVLPVCRHSKTAGMIMDFFKILKLAADQADDKLAGQHMILAVELLHQIPAALL